MTTRGCAAAPLAAVLVAAAVLTGCTTVVEGNPTWIGARLERALLGPDDLPAGVGRQRLTDDPGAPDGAGGASPLPSRPPGCSDGLTREIAEGAQRGPGSAGKYLLTYPGARIIVTVTASPLDLDALRATARRCARFEVFFVDPGTDPGGAGAAFPGIPVTTEALPATTDDRLFYRQRLLLGAGESLWMAFVDSGDFGAFAVATLTGTPGQTEQTLPDTFAEIVGRQADRMALSSR